MPPFKPQRREVEGASPGGGQSGMAQLMAYMLSQQKGQGLQQQLGPDAIPVSGTDPSTGGRFETNQSRFFTADAQNQLNRIKQLKGVTREMEKLAVTLPTDLPRAAGTFGISKLTGGRFGTESIKTYSDAIPAASAGVYRAITGDNRLSDEDAAARARPLFWHPLEGEGLREGKYAFLNFMMDEAEKGITPGEPQSPEESLSRWMTFVNKSKEKYQTTQQTPNQQTDKRQQYNQLRTSGLSNEEARARLGL